MNMTKLQNVEKKIKIPWSLFGLKIQALEILI
jgi:hypothetical protein